MGIFNKRPDEDWHVDLCDIRPVKTREQLEEEKWERRRWELTRILVAQERRSVVLGKLNASTEAIARKARMLADATINELRRHGDI